MIPVDLAKLDAVFRNMVLRVRYDFGAKAADLSEDSHNIDAIDCSGFVRFALYRATDGGLVLPDGSSNMHDWCERAALYRLADYNNLRYTIHDVGRLFISFIEPHPYGHVWLNRQCRTYESHGGKGVDSRSSFVPVLVRNVAATYELPTV